MPLKRCPKCVRDLPGDRAHFGANKCTRDGLACYCNDCAKEQQRQSYLKHREARIRRGSESTRRRRIENPEYDRTLSREAKRKELADPVAYAEHLRRGREWRKANPEKVRTHKHSQPEKRAERTAARNAMKLRATPSWADRAAIAYVFYQARRLTAETGVPHQVDHVIPLQGRTVCGLHVHNNLRAIPKVENARKGNRLIPELL